MRYVRGERCDADTRADQQDGLVVQEVLTGTAERTVDHDTRKNAVERRVGGSTDDLALAALLTLILLVKVAATRLGQSLGEVTDDTNVNGDVVFLRST